MTARPAPDYRPPSLGPIFDHAAAQDAKAQGIARAWDNAGEWREAALAAAADYLRSLSDDAEVTADEWRPEITRVVGEPPNPKAAWGALATAMAKRKWIFWKGKTDYSAQKQGHRNLIRVWGPNHRYLP